MPYYKILTTSPSRWGEGWQYGQIVPMDEPAARIPLERGEIELYGETLEPVIPKEDIKKETNSEVFICDICGKVCKKKIALIGHKRSHKSIPPSAEERTNPETI
jgi:hypothetical protein